MTLPQRRGAAVQKRADELGLGRSRRTYAITGVIGSLGQLAQRGLMLVLALCLVALVCFRPPSVLLKGAVVTALLLAAWGIGPAWRRVSADLQINRCHLYPGGVVVTDLFGQVRDAVTWAEVSTLKRSYGAVLLTVINRVELTRHGAAPLALVALGADPDLVKALQEQATRRGIPQRNVRFQVS